MYVRKVCWECQFSYEERNKKCFYYSSLYIFDLYSFWLFYIVGESGKCTVVKALTNTVIAKVVIGLYSVGDCGK